MTSHSSTHFTLAVHGGAGTLDRRRMDPARAAAYHAGLRRALAAGQTLLAQGGAALDAVTAAVVALEDDPLFNAGRGAVFTQAGLHEMDAALMDGRNHAAGAVAGLCGPRNPILAARAVMEKSEHVLLVGDSALAFCRAQGLAMEDATYFATPQRWAALQDTLAQQRSGTPDQDAARKHGTVGAVARDLHGHLAAATSTGGMTAKAPGRVGDSPVIGAGTWASNGSCAVSATGHGEVFIRYAAAHEIDARLRLAGMDLAEAARSVVCDLLAPAGGSGGVVAVDAAGRVALPFNCAGMYRGVATQDGVLRTAIFGEALADYRQAVPIYI